MAPLRVSEPLSLQWKANPHGKKWPSRYSGHHCKNFIAEHNWNCSKAVGSQFGSFTLKKKRYTVVYFCKFGFTEFLHYLHSAHVSVTIVISYSFFTMFQTIQKIFSESTWMDGWMFTLVRGRKPSLEIIHWPQIPPRSRWVQRFRLSDSNK